MEVVVPTQTLTGTSAPSPTPRGKTLEELKSEPAFSVQITFCMETTTNEILLSSHADGIASNSLFLALACLNKSDMFLLVLDSNMKYSF
jgi:hypothetical protein